MNSGKKKPEIPNPRANANIISSITYAWTIPIFKKGFDSDLESSDLCDPLAEHSSGRLGDIFSQIWTEEMNVGSPSLSRVIFHCYKWEILLYALLTLILDCGIRILQPILLGRFISYYTPDPSYTTTRDELNWYAFGLIMCSLIAVIMSQSLAMALLHLGLKIKVSCCSLIYRKSLKLSKSAIGNTTVGQVVTLLSNDVNRLETVTSLGNYLFVGPIQTLIVAVLMWQEIGVAALVGIVVLLSAVPLQLWLGKKISTYRMKTANTTDERLQRMSEVISGIRVIKMYAWEKSFSKLIDIIRRKEIKWISGTSYIRGIIVSFRLFNTRLALFASILCYVTLGNNITAKNVFVVTSFYALLNNSMTVFFPLAISYYADFLVSVKRIHRFLLYEESIKPINASTSRPKGSHGKQSEFSKIFVDDPVEEVKEETTVPLHTGKNVKAIKLNLNSFEIPSEKTMLIDDGSQSDKEDWNKSTHYLNIVLENSITLDKAFVKWIPSSSEFSLSNVTINIKTGSFVGIVGSVGAGKSSLLNTILKELPLHSGSIDVHGEISYASQESWLFNASIRDNILFGSKMDRKRYNKVIHKCALDRDFTLLPYADKTSAGENGCNLSGGQKARVDLARAVYRQADIYLFDDPLSAVDARVARQLFDDCMLGYLRGKTRLLVTHQLQYLKEVDNIIILNNGCVTAEGTFIELEKYNADFKKLLTSQIIDEPQEVYEGEVKFDKRERLYSIRSDTSTDDKLEDKEEEEQTKSGSVTSYVYRAYAMASGSNYLVGLVLLAALATQILASGSDYWISYWVNVEELINRINCRNLTLSLIHYDDDVHSINNYTDSVTDYRTTVSDFSTNSNVFSESDIDNITSQPISYNNSTLTSFDGNITSIDNNTLIGFCCESIPRSSYIHIYTFIIISMIIIVLGRSHLFFWSAMRASITLHLNMFRSITRGTMRFFNQNPSGRILNRFSKDMNSVDEVLPLVMIDVLQITLQILGVYFISIMINYWLLIPILFTLAIFITLRMYYIPTSRSIFRLVGVTRSPTLSHLSASLRGITTIRAFGNQRTLEKEFDNLQNIQTTASYLSIATSRAFGFWLDSVCVLFIGIVIMSFVFAATNTLGGNVGLVISQVMGLTAILQYGMRISTQMENEMISVERILEYTDIEHEAPFTTKLDEQIPENWPREGQIVFNDVSLRYSPTKAPALRDLSVVFKQREKIGIVGRTGAGKSSIINALFRLEFIEGIIEIDGHRTDKLGLHALRSRLSIIPQEPVLFTGSVRSNLDPFDEYSDETLWSALEKAELKYVVSDLSDGLNAVMSEGGANFSVGQRQLFCLARAIIRNNLILILDEATANVDQETDSLIQHTVRTQFANCTVLTIAHRLQTIMDSDKVLVMDAGKMVEYDHPYILLQNSEGFFYRMAQEHGNARMEAFIDTAKKSYDEIQNKKDT